MLPHAACEDADSPIVGLGVVFGDVEEVFGDSKFACDFEGGQRRLLKK